VRRLFVIVAVLTVAVAGAVVAGGAGGKDDARTYKIVFDNAFGLVKGADFKVGGVSVGQIKDLDVERSSSRALITVTAVDKGFGGLHDDAKCTVQPQSLIGEYFVDCEPGQGKLLESGATVPVKNTESPIPADLVANVMRRPYRERFSIILGEFGAGLAARGDDLNETIKRGIPALTETDRVLKILGDNRKTLRALARDSGEVMKVLGARRKDVGRFVVEARDTAEATADRREALAETFRRFPGFLDELQPTMAALGVAAREQAPALADLNAAAPSLTGLLRAIPPFTKAAQPSLESLGDASGSGRRAAREAQSMVKLLRGLGEQLPEAASNGSLVLNDLDDRSRAVEKDPDSPGGQGYTGFEAFLQYSFDQTLAINIFDQRGYMLKLNALANQCDSYTDAEEAKADPERTAACSQALGPVQPGINAPDPSSASTRSAAQRRTRSDGDRPGATDSKPDDTPRPQPDGPRDVPPLPEILDRLPEAPKLPDVPQLPQPSKPAQPIPDAQDLLDFLLAP
jgi:virulence factor Mce-like protein